MLLAGAAPFAKAGNLAPSAPEVAVTGFPQYLESLTLGSPIADYGSHAGIKAVVLAQGEPDAPAHVPAREFLATAHYAGFTGFSQQMDKSYLSIVTVPAGGLVATAEQSLERRIDFSPWGWEESVLTPNLRLHGYAYTDGLDRFAWEYSLHNTSQRTLSVKPVLTLVLDEDGVSETFFSGDPWVNVYAYERSDAQMYVVYQASRPNTGTLVRAFDFAATTAVTSGANELRFEGAPTTLAPGAGLQGMIRFGVGKTPREAGAALFKADAFPSGWLQVSAAWSDGFMRLPRIEAAETEFDSVRQMAVAGLRMNLYAPRGSMTGAGATPAKVYLNYFFGWDTGYHVMGMSAFDPTTAVEILDTQFRAPSSNGSIPYLLDDQGLALYVFHSQPPVQGWVIRHVLRRIPVEPAMLQRWYERSRELLYFWEQERRNDDGLFHYLNGVESGWDDSPRFRCPRKTNDCLAPSRDIRAVDLASWLYQYYLAMNDMAVRLGKADEAAAWRLKSRTLASKIDTILWDETSGAYFDKENDEGGRPRFRRILTPAMAWPLFAGLAAEDHARRVMKEHLLVPEEFGSFAAADSRFWPVPSVAFNDPNFDWDQRGVYWQGQIWPPIVYVVVSALWRYGRTSEAEALRGKYLRMVSAAKPAGLYENYNAEMGGVGLAAMTFGAEFGKASMFQYNWSCAVALLLLTRAYEEERTILSSDTVIEGRILSVSDARGLELLELRSARGFLAEPPMMHLEAAATGPLAHAARWFLTLTPTNGGASRALQLRVPWSGGVRVRDRDTGEHWVDSENRGTFKIALENSARRFEISRLPKRADSGGCTNAGGAASFAGMFNVLCLVGMGCLRRFRNRPSRR